MMQRIMIVCFIFFFFTTSYSMDRPVLKQIPANKLPKYIGRIVVYKESEAEAGCRDIILGPRIPGSCYYQGYTTEDKSKGIYCAEDKLYKLSKKMS